MDLQIIAAIVFVLVLVVFIVVKRKNVAIQKILFPFIYLILYRSGFGIKFMEKTAKKYNEAIKLFGYSAIGLSLLGMVYVSISMVITLLNLIITPITTPAVSLVLPFTNIPGIGYLSFFHWIISLFILAVIHEFAHGIVAKAHGIKIKSSGFAFLSLLAPIIPAAFVEPDEKKLEKQNDVVKYSVFAAGPIINILFALMILFAFPYVLDSNKFAPFEEKITYPIGFSFDVINETVPAAKIGLKSGMIVTSFNGQETKDANPFLEKMYYCIKPGEDITLEANNTLYTITTEVSSDGKRGVIGVNKFKNERRMKPEYELLKHPFYWTKELIRWLFLLNFFIGLFNLLPLGIVDGGRIMKTMLEKLFKNKEKANKIWGFLSFFFLAILLFGLITTYIGNPFSFIQ